jgi:transposase
MNSETVTLSQRELQRVEVISRCVQGHLACARAAELLDLSPRQIKRLKARYRLGSAAALAHANRGRSSHRRLPLRIRQTILRLTRTRCAGFNDHHLCEKLSEQEGFLLSRETLRRLLRAAGIGSPRKRRPPAHRQRRLRSAREGELVQLDGSPHAWLEGRGPQLTARACRTMPRAKSSSIDTRIGQGDLGLMQEGGPPMVLRKEQAEIVLCRLGTMSTPTRMLLDPL